MKKIGQAVHVFDPVTFTRPRQAARPSKRVRPAATGGAIVALTAVVPHYYDALDRKTAQIVQIDGSGGALTVWQYNDGKAPVAELRYSDPVALPAVAGGIPPAPVNAANVREKRFTYDANNALVETRVPNVLLGEQATCASAFTSFTQDVVTKSI